MLTRTAPDPARRIRAGLRRLRPAVWLGAALLALAGLAQAAGPAFEPAVCPYPAGTIPPGERVDCGYLTVREDRATGAGGTVRLAVAILRSPSADPAPDPILYVEDGPGTSGLDRIGYWLTGAPALRADRDIILFDQRGTGHSQPSLRCWEFDELDRAARAQRVAPDRALALDYQTAGACHDRLVNGGINLAAYTTAAAAADINDLRAALGVAQWNLYGLGYGSRLALTVLRDYPAGVRSVILDGAQPPQAALWEQRAANLNRAFGLLFAACDAQAACGAAIPDLAARFGAIASRYDAAPLTIETPDSISGQVSPQWVSGDSLIQWVAQGLRSGAAIPYLPLAITQLDTASPRAVQNLFTAFDTSALPSRSGLWLSVECHDLAPFVDAARVQADTTAYPRLRSLLQRDTTLTLCPLWGAGQAGAVEHQPVRSEVPALVLDGALDPVGSPAWGELAASTLRGSAYYALPFAGHGAGLAGCGQHLVVQFVANPGLPPESGCAGGQGGPSFVTSAALNPGIYPVARWLLLQPDPRQWAPFLLCAALFLSGLLAWPVAAVRPAEPATGRGAGFARWLASMTGLLDLLLAGALVWLMLETYPQRPLLLVFGLPTEAAPIFWVSWFAAGLGLILLLLAGLAWRRRYWSIWGRLHYSLVALAAAGFAWLLFHWGLLGL